MSDDHQPGVGRRRSPDAPKRRQESLAHSGTQPTVNPDYSDR